MPISDKPKAIRLTDPQIELLTDITTKPEMFLRRFSRGEKIGGCLTRAGLATMHSEGPSHQRIVATDAGYVEAIRRGIAVTLTFTKGVRCGGCGETLPDQEGVARDCVCIRLDAIECICPDLDLANGFYLDNCPKHGTAAPTNEAAAEQRGPWYGGQQPRATRPKPTAGGGS